jgi:integrase
MRGDGKIYQRGDVWWADYTVRGRRHRKSTSKTNQREANDWLLKQLVDAKEGKAIPCDKVTVNDLIAELFRQYDVGGRKTKEDDERRWKLHLDPFFRACKAMDVTRGMIRVYIQQRKGEKDWHGNVPKNGTINRELAVLRESYSLAVKDERLRHMPSFKGLMLDESNNVRKGFLKDSHYEALATATAEFGLWLRAMFEVYYSYGWRHSELPNMRVRLLDFESRTIEIETSKNGDGRTVKMTQKVFELLKACCAGKDEDDYVFTRKNGMPVKDFRGAWESVTKAAGVPGLLVHDLRRTGARNLRRAGVDRDTVMRIGGWKTDSVFRRYNIVDERDLEEAAQALDRKKDASQKKEVAQLRHNTPSEENQQKPDPPQDTVLQ